MLTVFITTLITLTVGTLTTGIRASAVAATQADPPHTLHIETTRLHTLDPAYLSVAIDTAVVLDGEWWTDTGPPDLTHPRFLALSKLLTSQAPTYLRVGGTDADKVRYALHTRSSQKTPELMLTRAKWNALHKLSEFLGTSLLFTLNAGPNSREAGAWESNNAAELIHHATDHTKDTPRSLPPLYSWELGNEINGYPLFFNFFLSGEQYARDLKHFKQRFPTEPLAGPATAWWPEWGEPLGLLPEVLKHGGSHLDILTWHYYPQQSQRCGIQSRPAARTTLLNPTALDTAVHYAQHIERLRRRYAIQAHHWLGETGHAQCGGAPGLSDRWISSLWWLDQLGALAKTGVSVQVRQALVGSDYGLLEEQSFAPRPDYWSSVLWKQLMGPEVLSLQLSHPTRTPEKNVRSYAHCHPQKGVSLLLINLKNSSQKAYLPYPISHARQFLLQGQLMDKTVTLNGQSIDENEAIKHQQLLSEVLSHPHLEIPAYGALFIHLPDFEVPACL